MAESLGLLVVLQLMTLCQVVNSNKLFNYSQFDISNQSRKHFQLTLISHSEMVFGFSKFCARHS